MPDCLVGPLSGPILAYNDCMATEAISNTENVLDSRDIVKRVDDLDSGLTDSERECLGITDPDVTTFDDLTDEQVELLKGVYNEHASVEFDEWVILKALIKEIEDYAGDRPSDGVTLIRDSYFETYAREFAEDIGAIQDDARWPCTCIELERSGEGTPARLFDRELR